MFNFSKQAPDNANPNAGYGCPGCPCEPYDRKYPNRRPHAHGIDRSSNKRGYITPYGTGDADA